MVEAGIGRFVDAEHVARGQMARQFAGSLGLEDGGVARGTACRMARRVLRVTGRLVPDAVFSLPAMRFKTRGEAFGEPVLHAALSLGVTAGAAAAIMPSKPRCTTLAKSSCIA